MAAERRKGRQRKQPRSRSTPRERRDLPYTKKNAYWFGAGILTIFVGYICLAQPPVDGFLSLTLAPILLVIGYCILLPIGLLINGEEKQGIQAEPAEPNAGG